MKAKILSVLVLWSVSLVNYASMLEQYIAGKDYHVIPESAQNKLIIKNYVAASQKHGKVQVAEFFSYACPACYNFHKFLDAWEKKVDHSKVDFKQVPLNFEGQPWVQMAKVYYTLDQLNLVQQMSDKLFQALWVKDKDGAFQIPYVTSPGHQITDDHILTWYTNNRGQDAPSLEKFQEVFGNLQIGKCVDDGEELFQATGAMASPTIMVAGKYLVGGGKSRNVSQADYMKIVDFLVEKELAAVKKQAAQLNTKEDSAAKQASNSQSSLKCLSYYSTNNS